ACRETAEEFGRLASARPLARSRDELWAPALDHRAHLRVCLVIGLGVGIVSRRLRPGDGGSLQLAALLADVDDTPVGETLRHEPRDPLERRRVLERRECQIADLTQQAEPVLPLRADLNSRSLSRKEMLALLAGPLFLCDVGEEAAPVEGLAVGTTHRRAVLAN